MNISRSIVRTVIAGAVCISALGWSSQANADLTTPTAFGWDRGDTDSAYFEWDFFFTTFGGNFPDVGVFPSPLPGSWPAPDVIETTGNGFITSTGNIYSFTDITEFEVMVPNYGRSESGLKTSVLVQLRTLGKEVDPASLMVDGHSPVETIELFREPIEGDFGGGFVQGFILETLFRFELTGNADDYLVEFKAIEPSMSLDRLAIDTFVSEGVCEGDIADDFGTLNGGDGQVSFGDFLALLGLVGPCPGGTPGCVGDIADDFGTVGNPDGQVSFGDFLALLGLVGPCL